MSCYTILVKPLPLSSNKLNLSMQCLYPLSNAQIPSVQGRWGVGSEGGGTMDSKNMSSGDTHTLWGQFIIYYQTCVSLAWVGGKGESRVPRGDQHRQGDNMPVKRVK